MEAFYKEWNGLLTNLVIDPSSVMDWNDRARMARQAGEEIHMGQLFGFCVLKNADLSPDRWKYKYRVVFQGSALGDGN